MRLLSNMLVATGIIIGLPILFYFICNGLDQNRLPAIEEVDSGYSIIIEDNKEIDLEEFIVGVLPTEIEMESEYEAIKAQAIIIRTSILQQLDKKKKISADQLEEKYISRQQMLEEYGEKEYLHYLETLTKAVLETRSIVMRADGEYIVPLYHAISSGTTLSAKELYGKEISYLKTVDSSMDVEADDYMKVEMWKYQDAIDLIKKEIPDIKLKEEDLKKHLMITEKTNSGYIKTLKLAGREISGEKWKEIFSLNSTNFYIEDYEGNLRIITIGKGHGLGLSQFGANSMAKKGEVCENILKYYYNGIEFVHLRGE